MKRINFGWSGGSSDVVFSFRDNQFRDVEKHAETLIEEYGGMLYYTSRTGMSGAGYLQPAADQDDLMFVGYYRSDIGQIHQDFGKPVYARDGKNIFMLIPLVGHGGIDHNAPVVITDREKVMFTTTHTAAELLTKGFKQWDQAEWRECTRTVFDHYGRERELQYLLANPSKLRGTDAFRFVDQPEDVTFQWGYDKDAPGRRLSVHGGMFGERLSIRTLQGVKGYFHFDSRYDILDQKWESDPMETIGEIQNGWIGTGTGLFYRRRGNHVDMFYVSSRHDHPAFREFDFLDDGDWIVAGKDYDDTDASYPWWYADFTRWQTDLPNLADLLLSQTEKRLEQEVRYRRPADEIADLCRRNKSMRICLNRMPEIWAHEEQEPHCDIEYFKACWGITPGSSREITLGTVLRKRNQYLAENAESHYDEEDRQRDDLFCRIEFLALLEPIRRELVK